MIPRIAWLIFILFINVSLCLGQGGVTLGDFARQERERRKAAAEAAHAEALAKETLLQKAFRLSGAKRQLEQAAEHAQDVPKSDRAFNTAMAEAFDPSRLMSRVESVAAAGLNDAILKDVVDWYRSPLGTKIAAAEVEQSSAAAKAELRDFAQTLRDNPPLAARAARIRELMERVHAVDTTIDVMLSLLKGMQAGAAATGANFPPPSADDERIFRSKSQTALDEAIFVSTLFTYRLVSDRDLEEYMEYLKSPSATAFLDAFAEGVNASIYDAARQVGTRLGELKQSRQVQTLKP
jgi:hypothetical protein